MIVPYNKPLHKGMKVVLRKVRGSPIKAVVLEEPEIQNSYIRKQVAEARGENGKLYTLKRAYEPGHTKDNWDIRHNWKDYYAAVELDVITDWKKEFKKAF